MCDKLLNRFLADSTTLFVFLCACNPVYSQLTGSTLVPKSGPPPLGELLAIDDLTANTTAIGTLNCQQLGVAGLAWDSNTRTLFGICVEVIPTQRIVLVTIDTNTGILKEIGLLNLGDIFTFGGLAFDPNSKSLYGSVFVNDSSEWQLVTIDCASGQGTFVGPFNVAGAVTSLAFDPNTDTLFGSTNANFGRIVSINTKTGTASAIGPLQAVGWMGGLAFDPVSNLLYGVTFSSNRLYSFDPSDGTPTFIGDADEVLWGLTFIYPPNILLGDVNIDGSVNLLDVAPFIELLTNGSFQGEADINQDGVVDLLDVAPFVDLLSGG